MAMFFSPKSFLPANLNLDGLAVPVVSRIWWCGMFREAAEEVISANVLVASEV